MEEKRKIVEKWYSDLKKSEDERLGTSSSNKAKKLTASEWCVTNKVLVSNLSIWKKQYALGYYDDWNGENNLGCKTQTTNPLDLLNNKLGKAFPWLKDDLEVRHSEETSAYGLFAKRELKSPFPLGYCDQKAVIYDENHSKGKNTIARVDYASDSFCSYVNDNINMDNINVKSLLIPVDNSVSSSNQRKSFIYVTVKDVEEDAE